MKEEEIKGLFRDILREYPDLHAQYNYDEKRHWFGICIYDDYHHMYNFVSDPDKIDFEKVRREIDKWQAAFSI